MFKLTQYCRLSFYVISLCYFNIVVSFYVSNVSTGAGDHRDEPAHAGVRHLERREHGRRDDHREAALRGPRAGPRSWGSSMKKSDLFWGFEFSVGD